MNQIRRNANSQSGMSLIEVVVATSIFLVIMVAALMIYDQSNKIFKTSVESADLQQNTRAGFDRLVSDVRMAGFDFDRDGVPTRAAAGPWQPSTSYAAGAIVSPTVPNGFSYRAVTGGVSGPLEPASWPTAPGTTFDTDGSITWVVLGPVFQQPDEQIEFAGRSAIVLRGNLDYNQTSAANPHHGREAAYEPLGGQFPVVTTGNDEIVAYALRSVNGANPDTLEFWADVSKPRATFPGGSAERRVQIRNIDLCTSGCQNPPYNLVRFTVKDDNSGEVTDGTIVATNVRNLEFFYYQDLGGRTLLQTLDNPPVDVPGGHGAIGGDGRFDPTNIGGTANWGHRTMRSRIQSVRVDLVGMNERPDSRYTNPSETVATLKNYRTYTLQSLVTPRNLGLSGMPEPDAAPPGPPIVTSVCVGSCRVTRVRWDPPVTGNVDTYEVRWDLSPTGTFANIGVVVPGDVISAPVFGLTAGVQHYFRVVAINANGRATSQNTLSRTPVNTTKPGPIPTLQVTAGAAADQNKITLSWPAPTDNDPSLATLSCTGIVQSGAQIDPAEVIQFRVWRGTSEDFNPAATPPQGEVVLDSAATPQALGAPGSQIVWIDDVSNLRTKPPANCKNYWYRVQVYDLCSLPTEPANANNPPNPATGQSTIFPRAESTGTDPAIPGYASSTVVPTRPTNPAVRFADSRCNRGLNTCEVRLAWEAVKTDTSNPTQAITIDQYRISRERKKSADTSWTFDTVLPVLVNASSDPTHMEDNERLVVYTDTTARDHDPNDRRKWYYRYTIAALQCGAESAPSAPVNFPVSCGLAESSVIDSGASSGNGSQASPWVLGANDGIIVIPPATETMSEVEFETYPESSGAGAPIDRQTSTGPEFKYFWENQSDGQVYRVVITMRNAQGCTEQTERFIMDDPINCASSTMTHTGASQGAGTETLPWLMNAGDKVTVNPPSGSPIRSVRYSLFQHPGNNAVGTPIQQNVQTPPVPFEYVWTDTGKTFNQKYRLQLEIIYIDGCAETVERFITHEPPPVCVGATATASGAAAGTGLTAATPWLFNGGDTITITPATNGIINQVVFTTTAVTVGAATVPVTTDSSSPFVLTWTNSATDNAVYRVDAVITYAPGCTETVTRFVQDQVCSGGTVSQTGSTGAGTGLTTVSPWVFDNGDVVTVAPPAGSTFTDVSFRLFNEPGTSAIA
ncbi:MAG TPA: fibronectin type III domain-containing protein, partial [Thermoanaerobaculia bacterium]